MLTPCDWLLALAAYAYEHYDSPIMTDNSYDRLAKEAGQRGTEIPGFGDMTGQWVHNMDFEVLDMLLHRAWEYSNGNDDIHAPAVIQALDDVGMEYACCHAKFKCWE